MNPEINIIKKDDVQEIIVRVSNITIGDDEVIKSIIKNLRCLLIKFEEIQKIEPHKREKELII